MAQINMTRSRQRMTDREICEAVMISQATLHRYNGKTGRWIIARNLGTKLGLSAIHFCEFL